MNCADGANVPLPSLGSYLNDRLASDVPWMLEEEVAQQRRRSPQGQAGGMERLAELRLVSHQMDVDAPVRLVLRCRDVVAVGSVANWHLESKAELVHRIRVRKQVRPAARVVVVIVVRIVQQIILEVLRSSAVDRPVPSIASGRLLDSGGGISFLVPNVVTRVDAVWVVGLRRSCTDPFRFPSVVVSGLGFDPPPLQVRVHSVIPLDKRRT
jgi:hypothetical protein